MRDIFIPEDATAAAAEAAGITREQAYAALKAADPHLGWQDSGRSTIWAVRDLIEAQRPYDAAEALVSLNNEACQLATWLDGYDERTGDVRDPNAIEGEEA